MNDLAPKPRLSAALTWGWLSLVVLTLGWQLGSRFGLEWVMTQGQDFEGMFEIYAVVSRLRWVAGVLLWAILAVGLSTTAKVQGSPRLRQATACVIGQTVIDGAALLAYVFDLAPDAEWVSHLEFVSSGLRIAGGVLVLLHARDGEARDSDLTLPALGLGAYGLIAILSELLILEVIDWSSSGDLGLSVYFYVVLALHALFWLSWLSLPRAVLDLNARPEAAELGEDGALTQLPKHDSTQDIVVGLLFAGGGLAVTALSFAGGGLGGRALLAWGPILYGVFRLIRGLSRS